MYILPSNPALLSFTVPSSVPSCSLVPHHSLPSMVSYRTPSYPHFKPVASKLHPIITCAILFTRPSSLAPFNGSTYGRSSSSSYPMFIHRSFITDSRVPLQRTIDNYWIYRTQESTTYRYEIQHAKWNTLDKRRLHKDQPNRIFWRSTVKQITILNHPLNLNCPCSALSPGLCKNCFEFTFPYLPRSFALQPPLIPQTQSLALILKILQSTKDQKSPYKDQRSISLTSSAGSARGTSSVDSRSRCSCRTECGTCPGALALAAPAKYTLNLKF